METDTPDLIPERPRLSTRSLFVFLTVFTLDLLLPGLLAAGLVLALFTFYHSWRLNQTLALVLYGCAVTLLALILSLVINFLVPPFRRMFKNARNPTVRRGIILLGGVVIPIVLLVGANAFLLPGGSTPMVSVMSAASRQMPGNPAEEVGSLALQTQNPSTRLYGIQVLRGFRSPEALAQLIRLASSNPQALQDGATREALVSAVASYGADAKTPLLNLFRSIDPAQPGQTSPVGGDFYTRYFSRPFESLRNEIAADTQDPAGNGSRLAKVTGTEEQLKEMLSVLDENSAAPAGDLRLHFVIQSFLQMNLNQDADLLSFAKATAADGRYSNRIRGDALLLVARSGSAKDMDGLYPYIRSEDVILQSRALQAIAILQEKSGLPGGE